VATAFEIFWMICEPVLFGLTGTQIILNQLEIRFVTTAIACVIIAIVVRKNKAIVNHIHFPINLEILFKNCTCSNFHGFYIFNT
jgi:hypothetical protein